MLRILCFFAGVIVGTSFCLFVDPLSYDYNSRHPINTYRKFPNSLILVVAHDPDMEHIKESNGAGPCFTVRIKDKKECEDFQTEIWKKVFPR